MTWGEILQDWYGQLDRLIDMFPYTDDMALVRFRGNMALLAAYIADTHDLTLSEGLEAVEMRLLPGATESLQPSLSLAAE